MSDTVFYSWQSDLPNATNRGFILRALEQAAKAIRSDDTIEVEPVVDRDTAGVPGSPDIAGTIFDKIAQAKVFVCDVSIINQGAVYPIDDPDESGPVKAPRPTPNPNVLLELGYAFKALGPERVLMVMNQAFGKLEDLPFDLRLKRVIPYCMPVDAVERAGERKKLEGILEDGLRAIFEGLPRQTPGELIQPKTAAEQAQEAIEQQKPNQAHLTRKYMENLIERLDLLNPDFSNQEEEPDELLLQSIAAAEDTVLEFGRLAEFVAAMEATEAAHALYKGFEPILERYDWRGGSSGSSRMYNAHAIDYDFYKFLGHELFVTLFAFLIRDRRWDMVADLLEEDLFVHDYSRGSKKAAPFTEVSEYVTLLDYRNQRLKSNQISLHADLLNERHTEGAISHLLPMDVFMEADFFLYLRGEFDESDAHRYMFWHPWSALYMRSLTPTYFTEAAPRRRAEQLLRPLGVKNIEELREKLPTTIPKVQRMFSHAHSLRPLAGFDLLSIGSR